MHEFPREMKSMSPKVHTYKSDFVLPLGAITFPILRRFIVAAVVVHSSV